MSHRHHKPKRNKRYVPKHINIPVMKGLRDEFGIVLHSALAAAERGHFSKDQYDRIGQAINCIWGALELRPPKGAEAAKLVVEGAMRAMNDAGRRGDATGMWVLRATEQVAVLAGIQKAEELLPRLDVNTLHNSLNRFKEMLLDGELDFQPARRCGKPLCCAIDPARPGSDRTAVIVWDESNTITVHHIVREEERTAA